MKGNWPIKKIGLALLFSILMAYFEAIVVVYLRGIYYPSGFSFPLVKIQSLHYFAELGREIVSLALILLLAYLLAERDSKGTIFYFFFIFGLWDIFYYIWLFIVLNWPRSLFTWDVLYLIPVPWIAPVLAPLIVSLLFVGSVFFIVAFERGHKIIIPKLERAIAYIGFFFIFVSFIEGSTAVLLKRGIGGLENYIPLTYNWFLFSFGYALLLLTFFRMVGRIQ